jgi:sulfate adenylyltransferase subunit 1
VIVDPTDLPGASAELHARVCWLHPRPLQAGRKYLLKHMTQTVQAVITSIDHRIDITTLNPEPGAPELAMNDIGEIRLLTSRPLVYDGYAGNRLTGSFILIEQGTNATVGAGMLYPPIEIAKPEYRDFAI